MNLFGFLKARGSAPVARERVDQYMPRRTGTDGFFVSVLKKA